MGFEQLDAALHLVFFTFFLFPRFGRTADVRSRCLSGCFARLAKNKYPACSSPGRERLERVQPSTRDKLPEVSRKVSHIWRSASRACLREVQPLSKSQFGPVVCLTLPGGYSWIAPDRLFALIDRSLVVYFACSLLSSGAWLPC